LLGRGDIDVNAINSDGKTPLDVVKDEAIKDLLRSRGAKAGARLKWEAGLGKLKAAPQEAWRYAKSWGSWALGR
jgi:hypothetical protein